jgi:CSLREA domain-containing protein
LARLLAILAVLAALIAAAIAPAPAAAFTIFTVDDTADLPDAVPDDGLCTTDGGGCTLRAAVEEANALPGNDGILVPAGKFNLLISRGGALEITETAVIVGAGARSTLIRQERDDGLDIGDRVFDVVGSTTTVTISDVTIANGRGQGAVGFGGNIRSTGSLRVIDSTITGGRATSGGGISNVGGDLTVENSTISGNSAPDGGGDSGAIQNFESLSEGTATLTVLNSTISGNSARLGGGIFDWSESAGPPGNVISITNSTISGNTSGDRGGGGGLHVTGDAAASLTNTIVAGNTSLGAPLNCGADTGGSIKSSGDNIESGTNCGLTAPGDLQSTDPLLGPLADNGGGTDTHAIANLSPARDTANGAACPATDQRSVGRPQGPGCDIGAFELVPLLPTVVTGLANAIETDGATLTGTLDPTGLPAVNHFEFGTSTAYGSQTPQASAGGDGPQPVSAIAGGLISNTTYHYRLVATTAAGTVVGADGTFMTQAKGLADLPPPVVGEAANVVPVGTGPVFVCVESERVCLAALAAGISQKGEGFVPLSEARQIPVGSFLDTRRGAVRLVSATPGGRTQSGRFATGVFQMLQSRARRQKGLTELRLKGSSFKRCRARRSGTRAGAAQLSRRTIRRLRANARGRFRTSGRNSSATVRGTVWITTDRCDGTLTKVKRGTVVVRDLRRQRTIVVRAGKSYLAKAAP